MDMGIELVTAGLGFWEYAVLTLGSLVVAIIVGFIIAAMGGDDDDNN